MKLLFVGISLKIGGIERALLDQVNDLANRGYQVDLFLFSHSGAYIRDLDPKVNLLQEGKLIRYAGLTHQESKKNVTSYAIRNLLAIVAKIKGSKWLFSKLYRVERTLGYYDVAVSYFNDNGIRSLYYGCNLFVQEHVHAGKKIAWIHSDYVLTGLNTPEINTIYRRFDGVVNVSNAMKSKFDSLNIVQLDKSYCVYNILQKERILKHNEISSLTSIKKMKIVTVGRLEDNKGTMELLQIAKRLRTNGRDFKWFFIGQGVLYEDALKYIEKEELCDSVQFLGMQNNPYPFIKACDLYVSGSKSETFGISILEALVLSIPVVAYRYAAINEILSNGNGIICDTYNDMECELENLITSKDDYFRLKENTAPMYDYKELNRKQFDKMIEKLLKKL